MKWQAVVVAVPAPYVSFDFSHWMFCAPPIFASFRTLTGATSEIMVVIKRLVKRESIKVSFQLPSGNQQHDILAGSNLRGEMIRLDVPVSSSTCFGRLFKDLALNYRHTFFFCALYYLVLVCETREKGREYDGSIGIKRLEVQYFGSCGRQDGGNTVVYTR